jgi:SAM-dependent methyltransferase
MSACACGCYDTQFNAKQAAGDLKRYRKRGPNKTTRLLVDALRLEGVERASVLDIGGGVGAVHHELLAGGAETAVHVDASAPYIRAAKEESARRGHTGRVHFVYGDFVALAPEIASADVVTLDRVICCYPDMERLVAASASRAGRLYGAVFPRETALIKILIWLENLYLRVRGSAFRGYLHSPAAIDAVLRAHGLKRRSVQRTLAWEVAVYSR